MNIIVVILIFLCTVPTILLTRHLNNLRKKVKNTEESNRRFRLRLDARLKGEERTRRDLEEKLSKTEKEYKRIENELEQKAKEEGERRRIQEEKEKLASAETEIRQKAEKERLEQLETERLQLENKLSQAAEERRHFEGKLRKAEEERDRVQEEQQKLKEKEYHWQAEREQWHRVEKEITDKLEFQKKELEEQIHKANEEQYFLKGAIRELVKQIEDLQQTHANERQQWESEIEARDKTQQKMLETFDTERRNLEGKLQKVEEDRIRTQEEIKTGIKEKEELNKVLNEKINELVAEYQQLKEVLSKTQNEYKRLEEELKLGVRQEELEQLGDELLSVRKELLKSNQKRKRLTKKLRAVDPIHRGGRSRGPVKEERARVSEGKRRRSLKPELICWKESSAWIVGVELPEGVESLDISQDEIKLECDSTYGNRYPLRKMELKFEITSSEGGEYTSLVGSHRSYLVFKLGNNWEGPGRLVRYSTTGYYLIIAPGDWNRDEEISGLPSIIPESTQFEGFKAHFFYLETDGISKIVFNTLDGNQVQVDSKHPRFKLLGKEICDVSEDKGSLFVEEPPLIQSLSVPKGWNDIGLIVVGEEGGKGNRWRESFVPDSSIRDQRNLLDLISERSGWYFLRIYDRNNALVESMDFRFLKNLQSIRIEGCSSCLPGPNGYENIFIRFVHHPGCEVELIDMDKQQLFDVQRENGQTTVTVPANPALDVSNWTIVDGNARVDVTTIIGRMWWSFWTLESVPSTWTDKSIPLFRKDFSAVTNNALWLKLPRLRFTRNIGVGFNQTKKRFYEVKVGSGEVAIPLRDFSDCEEILNPKEASSFHVFVDSPKGLYMSSALNIISSLSCSRCKFTTTSEQQALSHIETHLADLIQHLSYDELWRRSGGSLPRVIYKCGYCSFYVKTSDLKNPTSTICSHIEHDHKKAGGILFSVVTDIDEIRENVEINLPHIYRCQLCGKEFYGNDGDTMLRHLQSTHKGKVFRFC